MSSMVNLEDLKASNNHDENADERRNITLDDALPKNLPPWWRRRNLLLLNFLMICPIFSSTNIGFDGSMLNGLQAQTQWQTFFDHPKGLRLGHLSAAPTFGNIASFLVGGYISDRYGRRVALFIGASIVILGAAIQGAAQSYGMFFAARLLIGLGGTISIVPAPSLLSECAYPTHRSILTTSYNIMWYMGATIAAWITYGTYFMGEDSTWAWRIPSLLQGFFPLCQIIMCFFIPESPRYLIYQDRIDEARKFFVKYHAEGDNSSVLVDYELTEIIQTLQAEKALKQASYKAFLLPENRRRLFLCFMVPFMQQMSGNGLLSYYLSLVLTSIGITSAPQQLVINGGLMIYNWGIAIVLIGIVPRFGRRVLFLTSTASMFVIFVIWTVLSAINQERNFEQKSLGQGVLAMIFLFFFSYNIGLLGLPYLYMTEVLPYHLRSKGMAILQLAGALTSLYNGYVNSIAMDAISWRYYIVYCCVIGVEFLVVFFFFPETKAQTLEESTDLFNSQTKKKNLSEVMRDDQYKV
ncbi:general substrate transporter [Lipomyces japonicus]|uniref:general substrate transporter n=1 Tax=Lipomyces japonicus TaxID=56871 RepID=UPI0034CD4CAB